MKITNKQLAESVAAVGAVARIDEGIAPKDMQALSKSLRKINTAIEDYNAGHKALLRKHWKRDRTGKLRDTFEPVCGESFDLDAEAFLEIDNEIDVPKIKLAALGEKPKLSVGHMMALDWLIEAE